jgi:hypothetical protein
MELYVELRRFAQSRGYAAYFGDLAAYVEMNEFETVVHAHIIEQMQGLQKLTRVEAEL